MRARTSRRRSSCCCSLRTIDSRSFSMAATSSPVTESGSAIRASANASSRPRSLWTSAPAGTPTSCARPQRRGGPCRPTRWRPGSRRRARASASVMATRSSSAVHRLVAWRGWRRPRSRSGMSSRDTSIDASVRKPASCRSRAGARRERGASLSSAAASRNAVNRANHSQMAFSAVRASAHAAPVTPASGAVSSSWRFGSASSSSRLALTASAALRYRASSRSMAARSIAITGSSGAGQWRGHRPSASRRRAGGANRRRASGRAHRSRTGPDQTCPW